LGVDSLHIIIYSLCVNQKKKEVIFIPAKDGAGYMRARREKYKAFNAEVEREKLERLESKLTKQDKTKKQWLNEKIDEELEK